MELFLEERAFSSFHSEISLLRPSLNYFDMGQMCLRSFIKYNYMKGFMIDVLLVQ